MSLRFLSPRTALAIAVVTWASAFPMIRIALVGYTPVELALFRYLVASVVFAGYAVVARVRLPPLGDLARMAGLGVLGMAVYFVLLGYGQRGVSAGAASLLVSTSPVFMVGLAAAFKGERPSPGAIAAMGVSFLGAAIIAGSHGGGVGGLGTHALAVLGAALVGAFSTIFLRPYRLRYGAVTAAVVSAGGATLALRPAAPGLAGDGRPGPAAGAGAGAGGGRGGGVLPGPRPRRDRVRGVVLRRGAVERGVGGRGAVRRSRRDDGAVVPAPRRGARDGLARRRRARGRRRGRREPGRGEVVARRRQDHNGAMDAEEFRRLGHLLVDWVAEYRTGLAARPVMSPVRPGAIKARFPVEPPRRGTGLSGIVDALERDVLPRLPHWIHPLFSASFPSNPPYASILADIVASGLGVQGMSWQTSPAATEVEEVVMDWLRRMVGLSGAWTGVIHDTASTATLCALL